MSDTIRVWTLAKAAAARKLPAPAAPVAVAQTRRPRRPDDHPPMVRIPQRLTVSGEIGADLCSAAVKRAKHRR